MESCNQGIELHAYIVSGVTAAVASSQDAETA